jgi:hypothetical protein
MKSILERMGVLEEESNKEVNLGAAIVMIMLFLAFIGTTFYILVSSFLEIS